MKDGRLLALDTPAAIKMRAGTDRFEEAFVRIVKGVAK
jgi:ABC-2 type transport system ATP-binding protein